MKHNEVGSVPLMEYLTALEGRDNRARGQQILAVLKGLGIEPTVQQCHWPSIRNIIVAFSPESRAKRLLFSAHYDAAKGSPGANDNASGVAVLLGLCRQLRQQNRVPVTAIFFDREEAWFRTPVFRLGVLGSLYYAWKTDLRNVRAVYNLEFCGQGELLGVWPVSNKEAALPALEEVKKAAARIALPLGSAHIPWLLITSDHLPFRLKRVSDALTLSLLPASQVVAFERLVRNTLARKLLLGYRPALPEPLSFIHSAADVSSRLNENSLKLMLSLLLELIQSHGVSGNP